DPVDTVGSVRERVLAAPDPVALFIPVTRRSGAGSESVRVSVRLTLKNGRRLARRTAPCEHINKLLI
ncbi:MAG: hypothetical protein LBG19_09310, partial [Prevotellaceae bacterium]|nr:hypothetical protein [Prevotellaceae bacterium]